VFSSVAFIVFLALLWLIYMITPKCWRKAVLLVCSYGFCGFLSMKALIALFISTVVAYAGAIIVEKNADNNKKSKAAAIITAVLFAIVLVVIKNIPYVIKMAGISGISENSPLRTFVLPVGFSFYAFSAIGYIYDVYQKKEKAQKDFVAFALFMGFFAKLVSGPIERSAKFEKQIEKLSTLAVWNTERISLAVTYMLWGYFLKLVVADRLALIVNELHGAPVMYDSLWLAGGAVFYSFQIYADFAGYTAIAIGCALLFGIELTENFNSPYLSKNITEFWRRWHISLSTWLRDYVYIPLGGNRKGVARKLINTLVVFILCGIWHGNGLSFLVWGLLHGLFSIFDSTAGKKINITGAVATAISRIITFVAVTFAWIFFRAESLSLAIDYIGKMLTNGINIQGSRLAFEGTGVELIQILLSIALIICVIIFDEISMKSKKSFPVFLQQHRIVKYIFFYVCIMAIFVFGIYGGEFKAENFIYMQF